MVDRLWRSLEDKAVTLIGRQAIRQVDEIRIDQIRTRVDHHLLVSRRRALNDGNRIGVAVIKLIRVVVADRHDRSRRVVRLQSLEQVGKKLRLCLALRTDAWPIAGDELDIDE